MRRILLVAAAAMLVACIDSIDPSVPLPNTETDVAGSFALSTANGQPLPIVAQTTTFAKWSIVADTLVIANGGTWTETTSYVLDSLTSVGSSTQQGTTAGTWAISNQQIHFTTTQGGSATFVGSLLRGTLTVAFNNGTFAYTKI